MMLMMVVMINQVISTMMTPYLGDVMTDSLIKVMHAISMHCRHPAKHSETKQQLTHPQAMLENG
jgi:ubiquinone biosynthesis protein UbiJ